MSDFPHAVDSASTTQEAVAGQVPQRRRSWRRLGLQFSLRSLLVATTLVAAGCWWWLQPERQDVPLGGGHLVLRRQVRTVLLKKPPEMQLTGKDSLAMVMSDGAWQVHDLHGDRYIAGNMAHDQQHGWWTTYHASGYKATEGRVERGARRGVWKTWFPDGTRASETTYVPDAERTIIRDGWSLDLRRLARRHGPVRIWHPNGQVKLEGQYVDDVRQGTWRFYDEQGRLLAEGRYERDRREGPWRELDSESGHVRTVTYVGGRTQAEHAALLTALETELKSGERRRQLSAAKKLEQLGSAGVPLLTEALREGDEMAQWLALRTLVRLDAVPAESLPQIQPLVESTKPALALRAMLALVLHSSAQGTLDDALLERLLRQVSECSQPRLRQEVLERLAQVETDRRPEVFDQLLALVAAESQSPPLTDPFYVGPEGLAEDELGWKLDGLDVDPLLKFGDDLPDLLQRGMASPDPLVRGTVLRVVEELVERREPESGPEWPIVRWPVPPELQVIVEQGMADSSELVRWQAEKVGVTQREGFGCGFSGGMVPAGSGGGGIF